MKEYLGHWKWALGCWKRKKDGILLNESVCVSVCDCTPGTDLGSMYSLRILTSRLPQKRPAWSGMVKPDILNGTWE